MRRNAQIFSVLAVGVLLAILPGCSRQAARSDAQVASDVQARIYSDGAVQSRQIAVQAAAGVVTLSGNVISDSERSAAANDAAAIEGVKTVINNLQVQQAQTQPPVAPVAEQPSPTPPPIASVKKQRSPKANSAHNKNTGDDNMNAMQASNNPPDVPAPVEQAAPVAPPPPPPPPPKKVTIPAGTQVTVRLNDSLDSERNQVGDSFHGTLGAPIVVDAETVIPSGADITGRVADVKSAGRFAGNSVLTLELTSISMNGKTYNVQTNQWSRAGKGEGKNTAIKAGGGAALGALIGGLAGGGRGAAIGAGAGGAAGTGVAATKKGEQIKLAPETTLNFQLINTLTVTQQPTNDRNSGRTQLQ